MKPILMDAAAAPPAGIAPARSTADRLLLGLCFGIPCVLLVAAYAWLAIDRGALWLWPVIVHESGRYTLGETVLYVRHFLREIPVDIAMALFLVAGFSSRERSAWPARYGVTALAAAAALVVAAFIASAGESGARSALLDLFQFRTRDELVEYGSHWHFHWLSTLWFGVAALVAGRVLGFAWRWKDPVVIAAWVWFAGLTAIFGISTLAFTDVRYTGHQAREMATHAPVTFLLACGTLLLLAGRGSARRRFRLGANILPGLAVLVIIPALLAWVTFTGDVLAAGQDELGLSAMVGAHFFEHVLDYMLTLLLVVGSGVLFASRSRQHAGPAEPRRIERQRVPA